MHPSVRLSALYFKPMVLPNVLNYPVKRVIPSLQYQFLLPLNHHNPAK